MVHGDGITDLAAGILPQGEEFLENWKVHFIAWLSQHGHQGMVITTWLSQYSSQHGYALVVTYYHYHIGIQWSNTVLCRAHTYAIRVS